MKKMTLQKIIIVCIVVLLLTNILLTVKLAQGLERLKSCQYQRESLPCQAVPTQFVIDEPECANKLLRSMNVTNVRILPANSLDALSHRTAVSLQNVSEENQV